MKRRACAPIAVAVVALATAGTFVIEHRDALRVHWHLARFRRAAPAERHAAALALGRADDAGLEALEAQVLSDDVAVPGSPEAAAREAALAALVELTQPPDDDGRWGFRSRVWGPPPVDRVVRLVAGTRGLARPPQLWSWFRVHAWSPESDALTRPVAASIFATEPRADQALACLDTVADGPRRPADLFRVALASPHAACRARAVALIEDGAPPFDARDVEALAPLVAGPDEELALAAAITLARAGDRRALPVLLRHARDAARRTHVARGLAALRDPRTIALLVALHDGAGKEPDPAVAWTYAGLVAMTGHEPDDVRTPWSPWLAAHGHELPAQLP